MQCLQSLLLYRCWPWALSQLQLCMAPPAKSCCDSGADDAPAVGAVSLKCAPRKLSTSTTQPPQLAAATADNQVPCNCPPDSKLQCCWLPGNGKYHPGTCAVLLDSCPLGCCVDRSLQRPLTGGCWESQLGLSHPSSHSSCCAGDDHAPLPQHPCLPHNNTHTAPHHRTQRSPGYHGWLMHPRCS
jgi:hypothetical protein